MPTIRSAAEVEQAERQADFDTIVPRTIDSRLLHWTDDFVPPPGVQVRARASRDGGPPAGVGRMPDGRIFRVILERWPQGDGFWARFGGWGV